MLAREPAHERTLTNGREADEANTGNTGPGNVETRATASTSTGGGEKLALQLGQFGLELTQMVRCRLVLLSLGHLSDPLGTMSVIVKGARQVGEGEGRVE